MKKALVLFLLLALVGGSLFAQEGLTWTGLVDVGIGMVKKDGEDDGPYWGLIARSAGEDDSMFARVQAAYKNPDGNAGFSARIQAFGNPSPTSSWYNSIRFSYAYGWLKAFDGKLMLSGGRQIEDILSVDDEGYTLWYSANRFGLLATLYPVDMFTFSVGLQTPFIFGDKKTFSDVYKYAAAMLSLDVLDASAHILTKKDYADAVFAVAVKVLPFDLDASVCLEDLTDYSDSGYMTIAGHAGFDLIGASININGYFVKSNNAGEEDPGIKVRLAGQYPIGNIVPKLVAQFVKGGEFGYEALIGSTSYTFNSDQTYIAFTPSVQFRVSSTKLFEVGGIINKDLGELPAAGPKAKGMNFGAFANLRVSF